MENRYPSILHCNSWDWKFPCVRNHKLQCVYIKYIINLTISEYIVIENIGEPMLKSAELLDFYYIICEKRG